jgi:DNA modification methylase
LDQIVGTVERVKCADLHPYHQNARLGNIPLIVESITEHGQYKPLVVNIGTQTGRPNEVLAGNQTLAALLKMGEEYADVWWLDVDDDEARRIVLVDNRASDKGTYDSDLLASMLIAAPDLTGTGYSAGDLQRLLNGLGLDEQGGATDPDAVPDAPINPRTKVGDVWLLGPHRLVCGDSTFVAVVKEAAGEGQIDALWTDPPYGVEYVGKTKAALTIKNDGSAGLFELLHSAFVSALTVLRPGAPCYVAHADTERMTFERALVEAGYLVRQNLIWVKNTLVLGRSDYQYKHEPILELTAGDDPSADVSRETGDEFDLVEAPDGGSVLIPEIDPATHEPILYGFTPGAKGRLGRGSENWFGDNKKTTVFEVAKPPASREHPTMKPVELIKLQLKNSVARGGSVLDLFAGSGSTLIAAHQLKLNAHLVELDPVYCDVICRRYEEHAGIMPILERTGEPVTFVTAA